MDAQDIMKLKDDQFTDTLVAEMVMSERKPDYKPENYLELNIDSNVIPPLSSNEVLDMLLLL